MIFTGSDGQLSFHIKNNGISYQLYRIDKWKDADKNNSKKEHIFDSKKSEKIPERITIYRIDANWLNTNQDFTMQTDEASSDNTNFYLAHCPKGILDVRSYKGAFLKNIYNNIDLHYYEREGVLKYDYIIAPHANYKSIQTEIKGAEIKLQKDGSLLLKTPLGDVQEGKPIAYQNGKRMPVSWKVKNNILSFEIKNYNPDLELIIDPPTRVWGTYYGGMLIDDVECMTKDASSNAFISGNTTSIAGIATSGAYQTTHGGSQEAYLVKFNSAGARQWATYYGGSSIDFGRTCTTDQLGNIYLSGNTASSVTIASPGASQLVYAGGGSDAFLVKFNTSGVRQWGTYYGAAGNDAAYASCTDALGNVYIAGTTSSASSTLIATPGAHQPANGGSTDSFLAKFSSSGVRQWSTYYGGNSGDGVYSCSIDALNNVYIAGNTSSTNGTSVATASSYQSTIGGALDAFFVKFNSSGLRQWGTYYGGTGNDDIQSCTIDYAGDIYVVGSSSSPTGTAIATTGSHQSNFGGGFYDAFVAKFDNSGMRKWATYYGGSGNENGNTCSTDVNGNVYLGGFASSIDSIATPSAHQVNYAGGTGDGFLAKFDSLGTRSWGTYYGGPGDDGINSCVADGVSNVYICGTTQTNSGTAIADNLSFQSVYGGGFLDGFLARFNDCIPDQPGPISGNINVCFGSGFQAYSTPPLGNANSYTWSLPGGWTGTSVTNSITVNTGTVSGTMSITATNTCGTTPETILSVSVNPLPTINVSTTNTLLCTGQSATLTASGAVTYSWSTSGSGNMIVISPTVNTTYTVIGNDVNGCVNDTVFTQTVSTCVGLTELISSGNNLMVYPNPFTTTITIVSESEKLIQVFNVLGSLIYTKRSDYKIMSLDLSAQPNGIYFIRIGTFNKKIIKE
ncbi:MAG: SBBP repeat-containing protein [Bacteroidetes bacterium]|nr:SBBP repeat-containing protein [Bacteroidota bacterium]